MIVMDLDGTLANCEHRRHFVDRDKAAEKGICYEDVQYDFGGVQNGPWVLVDDPDRLWKPDWKAFFEACDKDAPIMPTITLTRFMLGHDYYDEQEDVHIWSGRCESVRNKTEKWLEENSIAYNGLKMRPIGDNTPDDELKERWLDEAISQGKTIDFVFDDRPKVVRMWRRRGIFVFDVNQSGMEF